MKVAFWLKNNGKTLNLDEFQYGNPGIGGTQFEIGMVSTLLQQMYENINVSLYTDSLQVKSNIIDVVYVESFDVMFKKIINNNEVLIFTQSDVDKLFYQKLCTSNCVAIAWVHNFLLYSDYLNLAKISNIKKIVFVGQQLYDHYIDTPLRNKAVVIFNCIPKVNVEFDNKKNNNVAYVGALQRQKGFHVLAKAWKRVLKDCPDAKLYVFGGGLYGSVVKQSKYQKYCNEFLLDKQGKLLPSVYYMGTVNLDKEGYYNKIKVGVANPTGKTETFCLSAVEFQSHKIPVVTYDGNGLLDTVDDKKTGFRIKNSKRCSEAIIKLLKDNELNYKMSEYAKDFVDKRFTKDEIIPQWYRLITKELCVDLSGDFFSKKYWLYDFKWLRYLNYKIKKKLRISNGFSVQYIRMSLVYFIKKLIYNTTDK